MLEAGTDTVSSALGEILGIESERLAAEAEARRRAEALERERQLEEQRRKQEAEAKRRAEEAARAEAAAREAEREEAERRRRRELEELRVRRQVEAEASLAEERLRLEHERQMAEIVAPRRLPRWVPLALAAIPVLVTAAALIPYRAWRNAEDRLARLQAEREREREAAEARLANERASLRASRERERELLRNSENDARRLRELTARVTAAEATVEVSEGLRNEVQRLREESEMLRRRLHAPPDRGPRDPPIDRPPPNVVPTVQRCINIGTPLEDCFRCPGDPRC